MKTVMNNSQVKHVWAQQTQDHGRGNGSTHFDGPTLYSYATPIANFVTIKIKDGRKVSERKVCLITTEKYSVSTQKHLPRTYDLPGRAYVFEVKHIGISAGRAPELPHDWIKQNYLEMAEQYKIDFGWLTRSHNPDKTLREMVDLREKAKGYAEAFAIRLKLDKYFPLPSVELLAELREKVRKREAAAKVREEQKIIRATAAAQPAIKAFLEGVIDNLSPMAFGCATTEQRQLIESRALDLWRAGRINRLPGDIPGTYLRVKGEVIETSRGAEFPVKHGLKALPLIRGCVARETEWQRNGHRIAVGAFQIDRIGRDGTVTAGCHVVPFSEVQAIAKELGQ